MVGVESTLERENKVSRANVRLNEGMRTSRKRHPKEEIRISMTKAVDTCNVFFKDNKK